MNRRHGVENGIEVCTFAQLVRFAGQIGIVDDADDDALGVGLMQGFQYPHRVAIPAATGIVGDIGKDQRQQRGIVADPGMAG